jgi:TusA-related sulfurtransferase
MNANVELDAGTKTFASGLLPDLIAAIRRSRKGDLVAVISGDPSIGPELEAWCRFTRNSLVDIAVEEGRTHWVLRYGEAPENIGEDRPVGSRLWLYTNFDCNRAATIVACARRLKLRGDPLVSSVCDGSLSKHPNSA